MRTYFIAATALAACLPSMAQEGAGTFEQPYWINKPVIEALGRAEMQVKPNKASFSIAFRETGEESSAVTQAAVNRAKSAYAAMKKEGGDAVAVTSSVSVTAFYEQYTTEDNAVVENRRADKVAGYQANVQMSVTVKGIDLAGRVRAAALALGPEESSSMYMSLDRSAEMLREANEAAIRDARERAQSSAAAAGVKLGRLLVVQEGYGPCLGEWTGGSGNYYSAASPPPPPPPSPNGGSYSQSVTVTPEQVEALNLPSDPAEVTVSSAACLVYELAR